MRAKIFILIISAFLLGTAIAPFFEIDTYLFLYIAIIFFFSNFAAYQKLYLRLFLFVLCFMTLGIYLFQSQVNYFSNMNLAHANIKYTFVTQVDDMPTENDYGKTTFIKIVEPKKLKGNRLILYYKDTSELGYGDYITFKGKIKEFDQKRKNALITKKVIGEISAFDITKKEELDRFTIKKSLFTLREKMNNSIEKNLPTSEAGLASGLILGEKSKLTQDAKRLLQASGTSHIIALSGYNITIILSLFQVFRGRFSRLVNLILPFMFASLFIIMTGASASIIRAGIMGFMPALGSYLGRPRTTIIPLIFSAAIMVAVNPLILLYDVGFQLSFAAMIGIIYISPVILSYIKGTSFMINILADTLGAQLAVLPLLVFYFGEISIISPISNLVILSLVPLGMLVSFLIGVSGILLPLLAQVITIPAYVILKIINMMIGFFGQLPFASFQLKLSEPFWILLGYLLILDLVILIKKRSARTP